MPEGAAEGLEGAHRPGHFRGVATVCLKLFNIVRPQTAWFGRKDAQQVAVLKQLVRDLNLDVAINVVETVRDARRARALVAQRRPDCRRARAGARDPARARDRRPGPGRASFSSPPGSSPTTSRSPTSTDRPSPSRRRVGRVRLIDNVLLKGAS